jgi:GNAT superfamily N-acetyltransferase
MEIINSNKRDLDLILVLYEEAIAYQKTKFSRHWHAFDKGTLIQEIEQKRHWKIVQEQDLAFIFSVAFEDPLLWDERNRDPSIYLHRMVCSPAYRGHGLVRQVVQWALAYGRASGKKFIRLDTCADNDKLNQYYQNAGFIFSGFKRFSPSDPVPQHYLEGALSLYQLAVTP